MQGAFRNSTLINLYDEQQTSSFLGIICLRGDHTGGPGGLGPWAAPSNHACFGLLHRVLP
jgi:hypothetical protein